jgi:murein DD-endopeptidase MepM/ murein hydrolase activator NlpD
MRGYLVLRSMGWTRAQAETVYEPFILVGQAAWSDTWGAPRYGPGPIVRTHEGQDVFCTYGAPVLAVEPGIVDYDSQSLGGQIARLHTERGDYWYYAHLSAFSEVFKDGDQVETGDVIGYCGNTGNAISTPPHVHFGHYMPSGEAVNPMADLVRWLHKAERRATVLTGGAVTTVGRDVELTTAARRFGDGFVPQVTSARPELPTTMAARVIMAIFLGSDTDL